MMRAAAFAPTRGSSESCVTSAALMLTTPDALEVSGAGSATAIVPIAVRMRARVMMWRDFRMGSLLLSWLRVDGCFCFGKALAVPHLFPVFPTASSDSRFRFFPQHHLLRGRHSSSARSEEHTSELQSRLHLVCRL